MGTRNPFICTGCKSVFRTGYKHLTCCGPLEMFDPCKHGDDLVPLSNSWLSMWKRWGKSEHPMMQAARQDVYESGNYGAATILNEFVSRLVADLEND